MFSIIKRVLVKAGLAKPEPRRICGVETEQSRFPTAGLCKWPHKRITYYENMTLPGLSREQVRDAYDLAFKQWADVCDIEPVRVDDPEKANVYAREGRIDIPGMTLAWSYLPCGYSADGQVTQKYDTMERWNFNFLVATACHEIGHALGLSHLGSGTIMAAFSSSITKPQAKDITEIQARYGAPKPKPDPKPPGPDADYLLI